MKMTGAGANPLLQLSPSGPSSYSTMDGSTASAAAAAAAAPPLASSASFMDGSFLSPSSMDSLTSSLPTFIIGVFVGQLLFLVVLLLCGYYFFFGSPKAARQAQATQSTLERLEMTKARLEQTDQEICQAVSYVPEPTGAETCGWLNVLIAQVVHRYRSSADFNRRLLDLLDSSLNGPKRPSFLGPIVFSAFSLGTKFPLLDAAAVRSLQEEKRAETQLVTEIAISYQDCLQLGIETQVLVNFRGSPIASLPVSLTVSLVNVSGILVIECKEDKDLGPHLSVGFQKGLVLDFEVQTSFGETPVKDLQRLTTMIVSKLRSVVESQIVFPNKKRVPLAFVAKPHPPPATATATAATAGAAAAATAPAAAPTSAPVAQPPAAHTAKPAPTPLTVPPPITTTGLHSAASTPHAKVSSPVKGKPETGTLRPAQKLAPPTPQKPLTMQSLKFLNGPASAASGVTHSATHPPEEPEPEKNGIPTPEEASGRLDEEGQQTTLSAHSSKPRKIHLDIDPISKNLKMDESDDDENSNDSNFDEDLDLGSDGTGAEEDSEGSDDGIPILPLGIDSNTLFPEGLRERKKN